MANEEKYRLPVDVEGFAACMREQKERSRAGGKAREGVALKFEAAETAHLQRGGVPTTDDRPKCAPLAHFFCVPSNGKWGGTFSSTLKCQRYQSR